MAPSPREVKQLAADREFDHYIWDTYNNRADSYREWHDHIDTLDAVYRGDWQRVFPDESAVMEIPKVMNLVQVGLDDTSRLVAETVPSVRCEPRSNTDKAAAEAQLMEVIATTYWEYGDGELLIPSLSMDLDGAGAAFLACVVSEGSEYPHPFRIDPRHCFPSVVNKQLLDLVVSSKLKVRQVKALFPQAAIPPSAVDGDDMLILDYYDSEVSLVIGVDPSSPNGEPVRLRYTKHDLGTIPVAFAQMDTFDGVFRGSYDQVLGALNTKNRIVNQILDSADQAISAPIAYWDVHNPEDFGPGALLRLNSPEGKIERVNPAVVSGHLFPVLEMLERETRGGTAYPAQRQGEVSQSIASAAFVNSTMGQLSTKSRNIQRLLGSMRSHWNDVAYRLDKTYLDTEKPLCKAVGRKRTYTPSEAIGEYTKNRVVYGMGAGLDKVNQRVAVLQAQGAGLISKETSREQLEEIPDPTQEQLKIDREVAADILKQKLLQQADLMSTLKVVTAMNDGKDLPEAAKELLVFLEEQAQAAAQSQTAEGAAPGLPSGVPPEQVAAAQTALEKGGVPGQAPELQSGPEVEFAPPPLTQLFVGT